jgi:p90 ribosomal S6 kinase
LYEKEEGNKEELSICEFGFEKKIREENGIIMKKCYKENFVEKEVLKRKGYDEECEIWYIGIII